MLSGKDRGKTGKIIFVLQKKNMPTRLSGGQARVVVEGLNKVKKHQRAKKQGQKGQIISVERPVAVSSVQLVCPSCGKATRVGHMMQGDKKTRVCKKCGAAM